MPTFSAEAVHALAGPDWLGRARSESWERFAAASLPSTAEEIWRYSRIDELDLDRYHPVVAATAPGAAPDNLLAELPSSLQDLAARLGPEATVVLLVNGTLVGLQGAQPDVAILGADDAEPYGGEGWARPQDAFDALNGAFVLSPWTIRVAAGAALGAPVLVVHWVTEDGGAVFPRLRIEVGAAASLGVVEVFASPDIEALVVPHTTLQVADGAQLRYGAIQVLGPRVWQIGHQVGRVGRDASARSMTVALGGAYARVRIDSVLEGQGGDSELLAAYFGMGDQMHDLRTMQHHAAPRTRSDLLFKGAVANNSHSVYSGLIRVDKGAKGTNAFQTNRNLVLSEGAHADSVPNLEIEDNDVRCSHASAVGPIDEGQLFYLESRGVPTDVAARLIALGFVDDVLDRFPIPGPAEWVRLALAERLDEAERLQAAPLAVTEVGA